jgi:hypothetical protein
MVATLPSADTRTSEDLWAALVLKIRREMAMAEGATAVAAVAADAAVAALLVEESAAVASSASHGYNGAGSVILIHTHATHAHMNIKDMKTRPHCSLTTLPCHP